MTHRRVAAVVTAVASLALAGCTSAPVDITGLVIDRSGEPRSDCAITVRVLTGGPFPESAQVTGDDGSFAWEFPPGSYEISAHCGDASGSVKIDASTPSGESTDIVVRE